MNYKIHFLIFSLIFLFDCNAQSNDWELYKSKDGIEVHTKKINCAPQKGGFDMDLILLKVTNTSSTIKSISWKEILWYNDVCVNCNSNSLEYLREFSLAPYAKLVGKCEDFEHPFLSLFVQFTDNDYHSENVQILTKFELQNLKVE